MIDRSLWNEHDTPGFPATRLPKEVDVAIVGGGITGLTAAYLLKRAGKRVAVFERERIGSGETSNTSAHLTFTTDVRLRDLAKRFGNDAARLVWEGGAAAIDLIESNVAERNIACGFGRVPGFLCSSFTGDNDESEEMRNEATLAMELGFAARYVDAGPVTGRPAVSYADQAIFHPIDYTAGLASAINGDGSFVFERAEIGEVIDDPSALIVNGETIAFGDIIIATHVPLAGGAGTISATLFQTKLYPYSSYVLGARVDERLAPGLYSDTSDPYYYLRVHDQDGARYAIFGGEDHKTGQVTSTDECFARLAQAFTRLVPTATIERRWSGQVIETSDGLPFIGETAEHQYVGTGYAGNGLTFGTLAGMMMHDAVMRVSNPWRDLFDPHRKATSASALARVIGENVDYPYHLIVDRLRRNKSEGVESVGRGEGKVLEVDGKRVACHRTSDGELVKVSAVCTHLGCLVRWNGAERTWDCPCHGSRFTAEGLVLGGPAEEPLEKIED